MKMTKSKFQKLAQCAGVARRIIGVLDDHDRDIPATVHEKLSPLIAWFIEIITELDDEIIRELDQGWPPPEEEGGAK